ncbi:AcrR family transcriptional regulator [Nonomuraea muscovyensis]|uniref:AcrR family transcriptional regulator n=1 Tax=Nonomuraea muscovyensis TaxID=1124761 RepID=A0A7X0C4C6_9ACTN|nr:TetR family transcriptional regulator [Nonomuraea muscovyensis]MBB6347220.1 AcrR family transcriptional regulator [Nonomuraea muscovyensis]
MRRSAVETKAVILAAARERFAADGYEKATIRAIAADARIDPSMVMRYFGSKDRLFAAAAEFDLRLPDLGALPRDRVGATLVRHFLDRWEADDALQVLLRTGVTNQAAAERTRAIFATQLAPLITALAGDPTGGDGRAATRAVLVASQMLGMALCRYILRFPPAVTMSDDDIVAWLGPVIQRYLTGSDPANGPL